MRKRILKVAMRALSFEDPKQGEDPIPKVVLDSDCAVAHFKNFIGFVGAPSQARGLNSAAASIHVSTDVRRVYIDIRVYDNIHKISILFSDRLASVAHIYQDCW